MAKFLNAVMFTSTAGGTADFTVSAAVQGYLAPNAAGASTGALYRYRAESATLSEWEIGYGTYDAGTGVLTRTTVVYNSLGTTAKINFAAAPNVSMGMPFATDIFPFVSTSAPTDPDESSLWWKSDTAVLSIRIGGSWVAITGPYAKAALGQLPSAQNNTPPAAGFIGEQAIANGSVGSLTSSSPSNVCSVVLQPGVWDIMAATVFGGPGATSSSDWITAISTSNATVSSDLVISAHSRRPGAADVSESHTLMPTRVTPAVATTYYLNAQATFTTSTYGCSGTLRAVRMN